MIIHTGSYVLYTNTLLITSDSIMIGKLELRANDIQKLILTDISEIPILEFLPEEIKKKVEVWREIRDAYALLNALSKVFPLIKPHLKEDKLADFLMRWLK